jgi:hypothetical protein
MLHRKMSLCVATSRAPGMESRTEQAISALGGVSCWRISTPLAATKRVFGVMQYGSPPTTDALSEIGPVGPWGPAPD